MNDRREWIFRALLIVLFALCCGLRLWNLDAKSMMHDELLFSFYSHDYLYLRWQYEYLPIMHGNVLLYLQALTYWALGATDFTVRLPSAICGILSFLWIASLRPWLDRAGTLAALLMYTLSPGMLFFQRFLHQDALFLYLTMGVVFGGLHWWRTQHPAWLAVCILHAFVLASNKASCVFVFFSIGTFLLFLALHDITMYLWRGRQRLPAQPSILPPWWIVPALVVFGGAFFSYVLEGIHFDSEVTAQLGHDWPLYRARAIPRALGWLPDGATVLETGAFWRKVLGGAAIGLVLAFAALRALLRAELLHTGILSDLINRITRERWVLLGASSLGLAFFVASFTTFFMFPRSPFEVVRETLSYWSGQHAIGRIAGPFHQHLLNLAIYELPTTLMVLVGGIGVLANARWRSGAAVWFLLVAVVPLAFHALVFRHLAAVNPNTNEPLEVVFPYLIVIAGVLIGFAIICLAWPELQRPATALGAVGLVSYSIATFASREWDELYNAQIWKNGEPIVVMNHPATLKEFLEVHYNFDSGWNFFLILILVYVSVALTWHWLDQGRRWMAWLAWWFVTAVGAASYAREAVPQVGIHQILPGVLLAAALFRDLWARAPRLRFVLLAVFALLNLWTLRATWNLNFVYPDNARERFAYGPTDRLLALQMNDVRARIIAAKGTDKPLRVYVKPDDSVVWSARWYLRSLNWDESIDIPTALANDYDVLFVGGGDFAAHPQLAEKYRVIKGRSTFFWTPDPIPIRSLWQHGTLGEMWDLVEGYLWFRTPFDGPGRKYPAISGFDYYYCIRKASDAEKYALTPEHPDAGSDAN